jgi:DNA-directed RNA polymerase specialized sigma24 family protein
MAILETLEALRDAEDPSAPALGWAWSALSDHIDQRYRLPSREHDDVRQRTLLKVLGAVARMDADTPSRAEAWLRKVHRSARIDHHRTRGDQLMDRALDTTPKDADAGWVERVGPTTRGQTEPAEARGVDEEAAIDAALSEVLERCARWIDDNVKSKVKRQGDRRRAQVALLANVRGEGYDGIVAALGVTPAPSKAAVYKWVERGREQVILPALEGWEHPIAGALRELLVGARRADAGKPRPGRRSDGSAVSPSERRPSTRGRRKK